MWGLFLMLFRLFRLGCLQFPRASRALCQKFEKWQDWLGRTMPELNCLRRSRSTQIQWLGLYESLHFTCEGRQQNRHGNVASLRLPVMLMAPDGYWQQCRLAASKPIAQGFMMFVMSQASLSSSDIKRCLKDSQFCDSSHKNHFFTCETENKN